MIQEVFTLAILRTGDATRKAITIFFDALCLFAVAKFLIGQQQGLPIGIAELAVADEGFWLSFSDLFNTQLPFFLKFRSVLAIIAFAVVGTVTVPAETVTVKLETL